jgi:uncharacterized protein GlcG (DUF336 family)
MRVKRTKIILGAGVLAVTAAGAAFMAGPGSAASPTAGAPASAGVVSSSRAVVHHDVLSLDAAQRLANAAQKDCAGRGFAVSVAVVDPDGVDIVVQRADEATGATVAVARGKAHAAVGFQSPTSALNEGAKTTPGLIALPDFVILPGGEPLHVGNSLVGGVGVSGAPSGDIDDLCAKAGMARISAS